MVAKLGAAIHRLNMIVPVDMEHVTGAQHNHHCFVILAAARWRIVGQYGYKSSRISSMGPDCAPKRSTTRQSAFVGVV
jgi:hypothetical protein